MVVAQNEDNKVIIIVVVVFMESFRETTEKHGIPQIGTTETKTSMQNPVNIYIPVIYTVR